MPSLCASKALTKNKEVNQTNRTKMHAQDLPAAGSELFISTICYAVEYVLHAIAYHMHRTMQMGSSAVKIRQ